MLKIPGRSSTATHELVFKAETIPPLGFVSFYVTQEKNKKLKIDDHNVDENKTIEGKVSVLIKHCFIQQNFPLKIFKNNFLVH